MVRLYGQHAAALAAFVLRLVAGDRQRAEDVVQETMIRAWNHKSHLHPEISSLRPWLVTVARRIVIDDFRSRQTLHEVGSKPLENQRAADDNNRILLLAVLSDALAAISPAHQRILAETYFKSARPVDVAKSLGIPAGTVRSRTFYALRSLKLALEERGLTYELLRDAE
ncbi:sigma-70 family RNA polymerase sigma factor [Streptomyces sp. NBC_00289]|uniref:sigma-70 family RNA polymerase sigma factor n=1 Tax=Streptomyces sp. NBC_00289 TaxID=2975703 RepID=UPI003243A336